MNAGPRLPVEVRYEPPRDPEVGDSDERWHVTGDDGRLFGVVSYEPGANCVYVWNGMPVLSRARILTSIEVEHGRHTALVQAVAFLVAYDEEWHGEERVWWRTPVARIGGAS